MEGPRVIVALRWYGERRSDLEIVGPFDSFEAARTWGEPRGFKVCQYVWAPDERDNWTDTQLGWHAR
jgi:hypothetical protein